METNGALIIFAKAPVSGQVKTRLIPSIGKDKATTLYKELLTGTLATAIKTEISNIQLWISGDIHHQYFNNLDNKGCFEFHEQTGDDLGERMFNAFEKVLKHHPYAILIGSDCPSLSSDDLCLAMNLLNDGKDLVLGPAEDGGYYLIGLKNNYLELFSGVSWGKESVFKETCERARKINMEINFLPVRSDVDLVSDLLSYYKFKKEVFIP